MGFGAAFYLVAGNVFIQSSSLKWLSQQSKFKSGTCIMKERTTVRAHTTEPLFLKPEPLSERPSLALQSKGSHLIIFCFKPLYAFFHSILSLFVIISSIFLFVFMSSPQLSFKGPCLAYPLLYPLYLYQFSLAGRH